MKEAKTKKTEKQAPAPTLANLFGWPMTAVMRRLGKEQLATGHVRAILEKLGIKAGDSTLSIQVNAGRSKDYAGRGEPAELTAEQVKQLKSVAPEPEKPERKAKATKAPAKK
jgi:transposase